MSEDDVVKEDRALGNPIWFALTTEHRTLARSHGLARRYIRRMFHRWRRCFIPRMTHLPIYDSWSVLASTSRYLPPVPSKFPATGKSTAPGGSTR